VSFSSRKKDTTGLALWNTQIGSDQGQVDRNDRLREKERDVKPDDDRELTLWSDREVTFRSRTLIYTAEP
jgi:hypothetical protein